MGKILGAVILPHPPIMIEDIGGKEILNLKKTLEGTDKVSKFIGERKPDTIICITPHGPLFSDAVAINIEKNLYGDFNNFGHDEMQFNIKNNINLTKKIIRKTKDLNIGIAELDYNFANRIGVSAELDHGTLVPLHFILKEYEDFNLIQITYGLLSPDELYSFGHVIKEAVLESENRVIVLASGDLSHRLSEEGPYSYSPMAEVFDHEIIEYIKNGDLKGILGFDSALSEAAGECGLRSFMVLTGIIDGYELNPEVYSYEGPFGVGYMTAVIEIGEENGKNILKDYYIEKDEKISEIRSREDEYISLARKSLEHYIKYGEKINTPENLPIEMYNEKAACFVTLHKNGELRGCVGTISCDEDNVAEEIIFNAIKAGIDDNRFNPVSEDELEDIIYSVDILKEAEKISSRKELDVKKYGIIVSIEGRRGLLLPNIEGVDTVSRQIEIALQKGGIGRDEKYQLQRFEVVRHEVK